MNVPKHVQGIMDAIEEHQDLKFLIYLYNRWQDEQGYEDFKEYEVLLRERLDYLKVTKVNGYPFTIGFQTEESTEVEMRLTKEDGLVHFEINY